MSSFSHRLVGLFVGVGAWAVLWPSAGWATDPVERLRQALIVDIGTTTPNFPNLEYRKSEAKSAIDDLKSISQFRRAYFLSQWNSLAKPATFDIKLMPRVLEYDDAIRAERDRIGVRLTKAIKEPSANANPDRQIAVAILIAELAEGEQPTERKPAGKFASRFTDVTLRMLKHNDVLVRQAGLNALGKITPSPADVFGTPKTGEPLKSALQSAEVGPRRLAAYALTDLVKNAHQRGTVLKLQQTDRADEMATLVQAINSALFGLRPEEQDEQVRGYCLQAIAASATVIKDYGAGDTPIQFQLEDKKLVLRDDVKKLLRAYQETNPALVKAVTDPNMKIQLAALQALEQIGNVRTRVLERLKEVKIPQAEQNTVLEKYDPLNVVFKGEWIKIAALLERSNEKEYLPLPLRRAAIDFLESVSVEVEQALEGEKKTSPARRGLFVQSISPALYDPDRYVRMSAIRAIRNVSPAVVEKDVIQALGAILIETEDTDPDLTQAAAAALEALADSDSAGQAVPHLQSLLSNGQKDVESRVAAMDALVALGDKNKHRVVANGAFAVVISVLSDPDVRVRRKAAETLGRLGHPSTREIADEALRALRAVLRDDDAEVRLNASEAILNIVVPAK